MEPAAEVRFALDIDQAGFPERHRSRDARRLSEGVPANLKNGEAVHLPDASAGGINENLALLDHLANLGFSKVVAFDFRVERFPNMFAGDRRAPILLACEIARLDVYKRQLQVHDERARG